MEYFKKFKTVQIKTLKEEINSVVLEKQEFKNQDKSILKTFLTFLDYQDSNTANEKIIF